MIWRREVQLQTFSSRGAENARIASGSLQGVQNGRKAFTGYLKGLLDPGVMLDKTIAEGKLRAAVMSNDEQHAQWRNAWDTVAESVRIHARINDRYSVLEGRAAGGNSTLFGIARHIVRLSAERDKPSAERLEEYQEAALDSLMLRLYSPAPIYETLEIDRLESYLMLLAETLGAEDALVSEALAGKAPRDRAVELVSGTDLADVDARRRLVEGSLSAALLTDPLVRLVSRLDPAARAVRKTMEDEVEAAQRDAYAKIAAAKFAAYGADVYPDATGSLRLTFGTIRGYEELGERVAPFTTLGGLYKRHEQRGGEEPFNLPKSWLEQKGRIKLETPMNFISTTDVIGGNSGSPTINCSGEVVGLVFDINLNALVWSTAYTDRAARTVNVDSRAIIEALKVYNADRLVKELTR